MPQAHSTYPVAPVQELAFSLLVLERQLNAYIRLHEEDLTSLRSSLDEMKGHILALQDRAESPLSDPN